jgi:hypothetical protein
VNSFLFLAAVPAVVGVQNAAVVDTAHSWVDAANIRTRSTWQSICLDDASERVLAWEVVGKG